MPDAGPDEPTIPLSQTPTARLSQLPTGTEPASAAKGPPSAARLAAGTVVSRYRIESVLGEGGMGTVYVAWQEKPDRRVALKVVRPGYATEKVLKRFEMEAEVLGRLLHPGIAQIYEAGTAEIGAGPQPFFAMELVNGVPLTQFARQKAFGTRQRLELMARVCDAVQHAHQKGVIHRDLKPGNILVTEEGQPKVLDFGVARATDADIQSTTLQTDVGQLIGTVPYMSPEQVGGDPADLDTRSDVYALGVVLYELLAGRLPYALEKRLIHEAVRIIREEEPARLSSIDRTLRGDVETIVAHALEKDKTRRYQAASALGADLRRYLGNEPIAARPASTWYQLAKFSRRNKGLVGGVAAAFVFLSAGLAFALVSRAEAVEARNSEARARQSESEQRRQAEVERDEAEKARKRAELIAEFMSDTLEGAGPSVARGRNITMLKEMMDAAAERIDKGDLKSAPEAELRLRVTIGDTYRDLALFDNALRMVEPSLELARVLYAGDHADVAASLSSLAGVRESLGRAVEAEPLYVQALEMYRRLYPGDHPRVATGLNNLAGARDSLGRAAEAEPLFDQALEMLRRLYPGGHPDVATGLNNLAAVRKSLGRATEAEPMYAEALEMARRTYRGDHPDVAAGLYNLAGVRESLGRAAEAEPLYVEALEVNRRLYAGDHPSVALTLSSVASVRQSLGRFAEAEPIHVQALEMLQRLFPGDHPLVALSLTNLASVRTSLGRAAEAEPLSVEALEMYGRLYQDDHPDLAAGLNNVAHLRWSLGRAAEAEPLFEQALEMYRRLFPGDHPLVALGLNNLASARQSLGRAAEAEPLFEHALEMRRRLFPGDHPNVAVSLHNLARVRQALGRAAEAEPLFEQALEMNRRLLGRDHPTTQSTMPNLAELRESLGRHAEAEALWRELLEARTALLPAGHWQIANARSRLGGSLLAQGRFAEAEPCLVEGFEGLGAAGDTPRNPREFLREGCERVVRLYEEWDRAEPGKGYDSKGAEWRARLETLSAPGPGAPDKEEPRSK